MLQLLIIPTILVASKEQLGERASVQKGDKERKRESSHRMKEEHSVPQDRLEPEQVANGRDASGYTNVHKFNLTHVGFRREEDVFCACVVS